MEEYLKFFEIRKLQIEPTSQCNLLCPQCARVDRGAVNPLLPLTELTPEDYDNIFTDPLASQLHCVIFNGNYGDPLAARNLDYVIDKILKKNLSIRIFTNGSLKNVSWWTELGHKFSKKMLGEVIFSIDGLEDTNSIYRINSNFKKIMENAKAYIQAGGRARWDFLVFSHNYHQVGEAKALAKKMGFKKFLKKKTKRFLKKDYTGSYKLEKIFNKNKKVIGTLKLPEEKRKDFKKILKKYDSFYDYVDTTSICCKYRQNMKALFIDFEALVWPCCWLGSPTYFANSNNLQKKQFDELKSRYEKNFNSLRHHSLEKILSHQWFKSDLVESWQNKMTDEKNPKFFTCGLTCGMDYEFTSGSSYKNSKMFVL